MKVFVIDQAICNGCYGCQIACKDEHCGNDWPGYQKPQPETGHFWMRVKQTDHGQVPKVRVEYKPIMCQQCDNCPLVEKHPDVVRRRPDGLITIDPEKATGMHELVDECPYHAVFWNAELSLPQKCDGCAHLVDAGEIPHCVDLCATEALKFGEEEEFADLLDDATQIIPVEGMKPRVYYLNDPKLFIGGQIYDEADDEVLIGGKITLTMPDGSTRETESDHFGDFWFKRLEPGKYKVEMTAKGHVPKTVDVDLDKSLNIGDFALDKA
ncbi:MAG: 4Fe-4S dicluster domain-containing protein [Coriobacteriales bacterium]|jgi:tetrathionate reductase subunit B